MKITTLENLARLDHAPSVQIHDVPLDLLSFENFKIEKENADPDLHEPSDER